jgi:hypothetical protein
MPLTPEVLAELRRLEDLLLRCGYTDLAEAAIVAVHKNECCSVCGAAVQPPTLCDACAAKIQRNEVPGRDDKTPTVQTERRGR